MTSEIIKKITELESNLRILQERFYELGGDMRSTVLSEVKKRWQIAPQAETFFGLYLALCVDTLDRKKQNRVRIFSPLLNHPDTYYTALDWANSISSMGGFDDCGLNWVPPSGSLLCVVFARGNRLNPYYIGTTWTRTRGAGGDHLRSYKDLQEYWLIHNDHRKGYLVGPNDESQVFPPWNTESYQGFDLDDHGDTEDAINAQMKIMTYPHIYGFKTPQKHMVKMDDGDYKCHHRWKRLEIQSSGGNYLLFKDDHLHRAGQWGHEKCACENTASIESPCHKTWIDDPVDDKDKSLLGTIRTGFTPLEDPPGKICGQSWYEPQCSNKYFKHENECRPMRGSQNAQNNNITNSLFGMPQTGICLLSISGHYFGMDDSVEQPQGRPEWERSTKAFDYGCTNKYEGKSWWTSSTGHRIEMNDWESPKLIRGWDDAFHGNYVRILSACGNMVELNDHTKESHKAGDLRITPRRAGATSHEAGERRGITLRSTSNHFIKMIDEGAQQATIPRSELMDGSNPKDPEKRPSSTAKKGFIHIRSGYGLEMMFRDDNSQQETQKQFIQIHSPQKDNIERKDHILHFQEASSGPGMVFLRVGGDYLIYAYDNFYTIVGEWPKNPSDYLRVVSQHTLVNTKKYYFNVADTHLFLADRYIMLLAGKDCGSGSGSASGENEKTSCTPCVGPVLVLSPKGIVYSDRVFASFSPDAPCGAIWHLRPFITCDAFQGCGGSKS